jgi:plasmid stabilization system protein ParE
MPQVRFAPLALRDLERLREFLRPKSPDVAKRAAAVIKKTVQVLGLHPQIGRPADNLEPEYRELLIDFGDSGHITLYRYHGDDFVTVLTIRHQKEVGYQQ